MNIVFDNLAGPVRKSVQEDLDVVRDSGRLNLSPRLVCHLGTLERPSQAGREDYSTRSMALPQRAA